MTPEQHYDEAEWFLEQCDLRETNAAQAEQYMQRALVHATLATITTPPLGARR